MTDDATALVASDPAEAWKFAVAISKAEIIPKHFRHKPADCFLAMDMARRLGVGLFEVMQSLFLVHGTPGFSAKYIIAMANQRGPFKGPISFRTGTDPKNASVTAYATVRETGDVVEQTVDMAMARAEGWAKNEKYKTMPMLMLSYRAATFLVRLYCPEVTLGMQTAEELEDIRYATATVSEPEPDSPVAAINAAVEAKLGTPSPEAAPPQEFASCEACEGSGVNPLDDDSECPICHGSGDVLVVAASEVQTPAE